MHYRTERGFGFIVAAEPNPAEAAPGHMYSISPASTENCQSTGPSN